MAKWGTVIIQDGTCLGGCLAGGKEGPQVCRVGPSQEQRSHGAVDLAKGCTIDSLKTTSKLRVEFGVHEPALRSGPTGLQKSPWEVGQRVGISYWALGKSGRGRCDQGVQ